MSIDNVMKSRNGATQYGMSLIEVLVGLVIGLIGVLVIFQTMAVWGERTATTVSGGDSRTSGAIGMHYLEQDLAQGGLGFGRTNFPGKQFVPGCDVIAASGNFRLAAVDINDGASGAPDTVTVLYGGVPDTVLDSSGSLIPNPNPNVDFSDVALFREDKEVAGNFYSYQGRALIKDDWVVLARQNGDCELMKVSSNNKTLNLITFTTAPTKVTSGNLLYLGGQPQRATWSISGNALLRTESRFTATISTISDGVVDIQAQYGLADGTWQSNDPTDWSQVRAVKVALLVRSKQFEKTNVTTANPVWHLGDGTSADFVMANLGDGTDWHRYRYEVFERTIPLRNLIWGAQQP